MVNRNDYKNIPVYFNFNHLAHAQGAISLQLFTNRFSTAVDIANAGDVRLFVVEQDGVIKIVQPNNAVNTTVFLNIQNLTHGFFYINCANNNGNTVIARYKTSTANSNVADPGTAVTLLTANQPFSNHNGGCLKFGPDGFLYIAVGDGGSGGDQQNFAQNLIVPTRNL